jgi:hypothetical protein
VSQPEWTMRPLIAEREVTVIAGKPSDGMFEPETGTEWSLYVVDEDRSWGWSNHVWSLGFVCAGFGETPGDAWREAIASRRVPEGFDMDEPPTVAVKAGDELPVVP